MVLEYKRRAEDALENYTEIATTRALTPRETEHMHRLRRMFPEAQDAANYTIAHRLRHPPSTPRPPARSPCPASPPPTPRTPAVAPASAPPAPTRTPTQSKYPVFKGLMLPRHEVLTHPAGPDLLKYAIDGCPVDCGIQWTREQIEAAIAKGAHASAEAPGAAEACRKEALERVADGSCRLINWVDICDNIPPNLKVSPIAAVPHKSRKFRMILDLSYQVKINGKKLQSVNETSDKTLAPQHAMYELGNVIPRLIWAMATSHDTTTPFLFTKVDLKDGYWRMCVNSDDAWNFAYVLPGGAPGDPVQLVIPEALQMGWGESPPFFCAATETARDIAQHNFDTNKVMPSQPMEEIMMDIDWTTIPTPASLPESEKDKRKFLSVLEVYIDDFIGLIQSTDADHLLRLSRTILSAITNVFPPPEITNSTMGPPVSVKKLIAEGTWDTRKEILGWLFDGIARTIELPENKGRTIRTETKRLIRTKNNRVTLSDFQKVHGKLQFAAIAIPCGKPLLGPLDHAIAIAGRNNVHHVTITDNIRLCLQDWIALIRQLGQRPTHVKELVLHTAAYQGFVDASKWGVGGVWFGGTTQIAPIVWFWEWPPEVQENLVTSTNRTGLLTISDLELMGILLHWLALEAAVDKSTLVHSSIAIWCDNLPAVSWIYKMRTSTSPVASRILRALAVRLQLHRTGLLAIDHISGIYNIMADVASRKHVSDPMLFLKYFTDTFPPPQMSFWTLFHFHNKLLSKISSEMLNAPSPLASWNQLPAKNGVFGRLGAISSPSIFPNLTRNCVVELHRNESNCWLPSPTMCVPEAFQNDLSKFAPKQLRWRFAPSARLSKWTMNLVPWSRRKESIRKKSASFLKATDATTLPLNQN